MSATKSMTVGETTTPVRVTNDKAACPHTDSTIIKMPNINYALKGRYLQNKLDSPGQRRHFYENFEVGDSADTNYRLDLASGNHLKHIER